MSILKRLDSAVIADYTYLRKLLDERKLAEDKPASAYDTLNKTKISAAYASSGVMSGNFTHRESGQSSYVQSTLSSFNQKTLQELAADTGLMTALEEAAS